MEGIDIQAIVRQAVQEFANTEKAKSEPAYKAELVEERKRRGNARSSVESNTSRVSPLYDAFLRLTIAVLDGLRVFNSSMRTGISL
jgi:hypothetical protein